MHKKDFSYCYTPFSSETPHEDFFFYGAINHLYNQAESNKNKIIKIRTVGMLRDEYGCFYIKEMIGTCDPSIPPDTRQSIQVSLAYMTRSIQCSSMPYPVQLFGQLKWCNRPVIFAQVVQPLNVSVAVMLYNTMTRAASLRSSSREYDHKDEFDGSIDCGENKDT